MRVDDLLGKGKLGETLISPTGMSTPPVNPAQQSAGATTPAVGTQPAANPQQQAQQAAMKLAKEKKAVQTLGQKLGPGVNQNKINTAMASTAKGQKPSPDSTAALAAIGQSAIDASTTNPQIADLIKRGVNTPMAEGNEVDEGTKAFGSTMMPFGGMPKIQENVTSTLTKRMQKINSKFTQSISENTDWPFQQVNELSNEKLGQYKKAAGADATAADKRSDFERGNKRFRGITTATKKQFANDIKKHYDSREQGVAEGDLNELAPSSGEGGNGPFDYGSAIIEIGQNFVDNYADSAAGEDAADIIQVGKTFMSAGMTKGISALFALDTQVYDHVLDELSSLGFNVDLDIISKRRAPTLDRDAQNALRAVQAKWDAQPGQVYLVTGYVEGGYSQGKIKATSPEAAKQKFLANTGEKFNKIDVKPYKPYPGVAEAVNPALANLTPDEIKGIGMMIQNGHDIPTIIRIFDNKPTAEQITAIATANMQQGVAEGFEPEGSTFKNSLHTIIRVATHLEKQMDDDENFPEWESEMVGSVKDQMVKIMNYEISKKEQQGVAEGTGDDSEECWTCRGTGEGQHEGQVCSNCHGSGVEPVEHDDDELWGSDYYESFDPKNESILTSLFR